ncbi:MAG: hypothetical protein HeimC3_10930 [Candidatus Heimdallarchaeota archaeon LC_3]|nr:MAG: hypothetical protein HeimC3_10930 [Candidatus Heimdallarchaeota archaeon LC_3]
MEREPVHLGLEIAQFLLNNIILVIHQYYGFNELNLYGNIHFNFEVSDIYHVIKTLKSKNITVIKEPKNEGFGYMVATINDYEGNEIDLLEKIDI